MNKPELEEKELEIDEELLPRLSKFETIGGWIMLPVYLALAGTLVSTLQLLMERLFGVELGPTAAYLIPYYLCFGLCAAIFHDHLARELRIFVRRLWRSIRTGVTAYLIILALSFAVAMLFQALDMGLDNPNQQALTDMFKASRREITISACFLAPLVEEVIFRSTIFGSIYPKSRVLAHLANWLLFGAVHVVYYAVTERNPLMLLFILNYLPHSVGLAYAYEKSKSVWTSIFLHMIINIVSVTFLGRG